MAASSSHSTMDTDADDNTQQKSEKSQSSEEECLLPGFSNINDFSQSALRAALHATRSSNELPVGDNFDFYSTFRSVRDVMDIEGRRIMTLLQRLMRQQNVKGSISQGAGVELEDKFDTVLDANDHILERAGSSLDEASGIHKDEAKLVISSAALTTAMTTTSWNRKAATESTSKAASAYRLLTARNIQRPQLQFQDSIDNSSSRPFRPRLRSKPHATVKTLEESLQLPPGVTAQEAESPDFVYPHPYKAEIESFSPARTSLEKVSPQEPQPLTLTPLLMVDTQPSLADMLEHLRAQTEIAVDLEHHSYRSFQGLACLLQISTRSHDYIVDILALRAHVHLLNEVFTDPNITKVLHGADFDVLWLQRDFSVYLVNLFDTGQAARVLGLSRFSLAHLMKAYCSVDADKQFQLADWRIRPLPAELVKYSREDTHYLLYIYDRLRNQLLDQGNAQANLLLSVYQRSAEVALKVYKKPVFHSEDYRQLYLKSKKMFNSQQLAALRDLYAWRDHLARVEDESFGYVLPNHMLLQICEVLPREKQGVLACCNPIPPLVRQSLPEIHGFVLKARDLAMAVPRADKPPPAAQPSRELHPRYKADGLLSCPHDLSCLSARIVHIEHSIAETGQVATTIPVHTDPDSVKVKVKPDVAAFRAPVHKKMSKTIGRKLAQEVRALFSNPFKKYFPVDASAKVKVKPQRTDVWQLKAPTAAKRKSEQDSGKTSQGTSRGTSQGTSQATSQGTSQATSQGTSQGTSQATSLDLDAFEPEFVQPTKKARVAVNLLSSTTRPAGHSTTGTKVSSSSSLSAHCPPASSGSGGGGRGAGGPDRLADTNGTTGSAGAKQELGPSSEEAVEKQIRTLRQEVTLKKKKEKKRKAKRADKMAAPTPPDPPQPSTLKTPYTSAIIKKEEIDSNPGHSHTATSTTTASDGSGSVPAATSEERKKKKKKKKLTLADVEENFSAFDYGSAEKKLSKVKGQAKDIYNPSLPSRSGKKDKGQRKTKLSGPHSVKNVVFGASGSPGKAKKQKK